MIEIRTKLDIGAQKKLLKFNMRKTVLKPINLILYVVILLFGILFCILSFTSDQENNFLRYGIILIIMAFASPLLVIWSVWFFDSISKSNKQLLEKSDTCFRFEEDSFYAETTQNEAIVSFCTMPYARLFKAFETETDFFFYIHNSAAYVIPKTDFISGSPQQLRMLLQNRLGAKYKIKGKF